MVQEKIRRLTINLPRQPLSNQRSWLIAGLLLVLIILLIAIYSYFAAADRQKLTTMKKAEYIHCRNTI